MVFQLVCGTLKNKKLFNHLLKILKYMKLNITFVMLLALIITLDTIVQTLLFLMVKVKMQQCHFIAQKKIIFL